MPTKIDKHSVLVLCLITVIFPPLAVYLISGLGSDFWIAVILTILGYIPGHLWAFWLIYKRDKADKQLGKGRYIYVGHGKHVPIVNDTTATTAAAASTTPVVVPVKATS